MERPYKFTIICNKTKEVVRETNITPRLCDLQTWEPVIDTEARELKTTKTAYVDTRYKAKLRLYNYISYTKLGLEVPKYRPFQNTEIGRTAPILNF